MSTKAYAAIPLLALAVAGIQAASTPSRACTCFAYRTGERGSLVGRNYDWDFGDDLVLVNKRGLEKHAGLDPAAPGGTWTSLYGSLTFNQYGREFPTGGVNEKGLVVEVLWLGETVFPSPDDRMEVQSIQWIQYQLDTAASVADVVASLDRVRISGQSTPIHFFVADSAGDTASIEFLDGRAVVHRTDARTGAPGEPMPVPVLTNHTYEASEAYLRTCSGWGGTAAIPNSPASLHRYARAATRVRELQALSRLTGPDDVFAILGDVAQEGGTQWSIVYDLGRLQVHFKTARDQAVKSIHLADLDFACSTPVTMMDVEQAGAGNLRGRWAEYTRAANRRLIGATYGKTEFLKGVAAETLDLLAAYPEGARCTSE